MTDLQQARFTFTVGIVATTRLWKVLADQEGAMLLSIPKSATKPMPDFEKSRFVANHGFDSSFPRGLLSSLV